jgi:RNA polymerase sigma factor (sigma-70 family)
MTDWTQHEGLIRTELEKLGIRDEDNDDMLQEVYVELLGITAEVQSPGALAREIARRRGINLLQQNNNRARLDEQYHSSTIGDYGSGYEDDDDTGEAIPTLEPLSKGVSPETMVIEKDLVTKALSSITDEQRQAVYLIDVMGYTYQEAADTVGISKQSFHRRHTRARKGLERWRASLA